MNRRAFLKGTALTASFLAVSHFRIGAGEKPRVSDEEILSQARDRIEKHRKGDGVIVVQGADGNPIPGARVKIVQVHHDFLFGCNAFMVARCQNPKAEAAYRRQFAGLFNYATLGFYWSDYERERGKPNYAYTDQVVDWCRTQGITCKGHPLVWDYTGDPQWMPREFGEIRALSNGRVRDIVARFKGRIDLWDVVNEPTHLGRSKTRFGEWAMSVGAVPYVAEHLKIARAANPQATLLVNDYRVDPPFYKILDGQRENGKLLFDAVGIQSHMHDGGWPLARVWEVCDTYAKFGLPVHFTEATIVSGPRKGPGENWGPTEPALETKQADYVSRFYTMLFAHPATQALTWWDFADAGAWQGAAAGLLRKDMSPKPVYDTLSALIRGEWWTKLEGTTNTQGELPARAFYGSQRVIVTLPGGKEQVREVRWRRGQSNRVVVKAA
jgi:endo-1,4-beta-xylanase